MAEEIRRVPHGPSQGVSAFYSNGLHWLCYWSGILPAWASIILLYSDLRTFVWI